MKKQSKIFSVLCLVLSLSLFIQLSFGSTNVQAASSENSDVLINGEKSLDKVMNIISKKIEINEKNIAIQGKATILNSIQQKDIDNINALAKAQGIEYDQPLTKENLLNLFNNGIETINAESTEW